MKVVPGIEGLLLDCGKGKYMRLRGPLVSTGALGLAVPAVAAAAVWASVNRARVTDAMAVTKTIRVNGTRTCSRRRRQAPCQL